MILGCALSPAAGNADPVFEATGPIQPGEMLVYKLHWGIFHVGFAVLETEAYEPDPELSKRTDTEDKELWTPEYNGNAADLKFTFRVRTNGFADKLYKVRHEYNGWSDASLDRSAHYACSEYRKEGDKVEAAIFHWSEEGGTVQFSKPGKLKKEKAVDLNTYDPITAVFAMRLRDFSVGDTIDLKITDGKKNGLTPVKVVKKETITLDLEGESVEVKAFKVEPDLEQMSEKYEDKDDSFATIWYSDDENHVPVQLHTKVKWGKFRAELVKRVIKEAP